MSSPLEHQTAEFRELRQKIEESILPLSTSVDGRRFELQASLHGLELQVGGYVVLESDDGRRLGQIVALELARVDGSEVTSGDERGLRTRMALRSAKGEGVVLNGDGKPFHDALARPADPAEVAEWLATIRPARATLSIGELLLAPGVPATLDAGGFDRHTFLCGQSGSGKTYSLGLVLERLLVETDLRLIILDPNSDYVRLGEQRAEADAAARCGLRRRCARCRRPACRRRASTSRLDQLDPNARAAALALDPVADREEFALVDQLLGGGGMHLRRAGDVGRAARAGASAQSGEPRRAEAGSCGRAAGRGRSSTTSSGATRAVSSSTSALCRRARSKPSPRRRCSQRSGGGAPTASLCSS